MRLTQLRQADLNLLVVFSVLAEERSVSRAASRLSLSQPAVSRALQRLREMFQDDLMIRASGGYEPTPKGERLLRELAVILPRLDRMLKGESFDPTEEHATFRIAGTDFGAAAVAPILCRTVLSHAAKVSFQIVGWHDGTFEDLERGRLDLAVNADDGHTPETLLREVIFEDEFVCVVARESPYEGRLTLKEYVKALHVGIGILGGRQTIPEQRLTVAGYQRTCAIEVPYFSTAIRCVPGTRLIATVPRRLVREELHNHAIKIVEAPPEMSGFKYLMAWHPRVNTDAGHVWLRSAVREAGKILLTGGGGDAAEAKPKARSR